MKTNYTSDKNLNTFENVFPQKEILCVDKSKTPTTMLRLVCKSPFKDLLK